MTTIHTIECPSCGIKKKVKEEWRGKAVVCSCGTRFVINFRDSSETQSHEIIKKTSIPVVSDYTIIKTLIGSYKAKYNCPHCKAVLHSSEKELKNDDECPECYRPFRVAQNASIEINSLREDIRAEKTARKQEVKEKRHQQKLKEQQARLQAMKAEISSRSVEVVHKKPTQAHTPAFGECWYCSLSHDSALQCPYCHMIT